LFQAPCALCTDGTSYADTENGSEALDTAGKKFRQVQMMHRPS